MKKNSAKRVVKSNNTGRKRQRRLTSQRSRARQFLRFSLAGTAVGALLAVVVLGYQWFDKTSIRPVTQVAVAGNLNLLERQQIAQVIRPFVVDGELREPLAIVKDALEQDPWIEQAVVNWRWPNQLNVTVVEQIPIARWGKAGFVNSRGEIVLLNDQSNISSLPLLLGMQGKEKIVMQNFQQLSQVLRAKNLRIAELVADELMNWHIVLENGTAIMLGRDQLMEKIQRFLVVYEKNLYGKFADVKTVDLRYGNGVAVAWREKSDKTTAENAMQLAQVNERRAR